LHKSEEECQNSGIVILGIYFLSSSDLCSDTQTFSSHNWGHEIHMVNVYICDSLPRRGRIFLYHI